MWLMLLSGTIAGLALIRKRWREMPLSRLIDIEAASEIANSLHPLDEDEFIWTALNYVGSLPYAGYGSELELFDDRVKVLNTALPAEVLAMEEPFGNCVAKSALLVSILRNRIPENRVFLTLGDLVGLGGHAWVLVQRGNGVYCVLEATRPSNRWISLDEATKYQAVAYVNDQGFACNSPSLCHIVNSNSCPCEFET